MVEQTPPAILPTTADGVEIALAGEIAGTPSSDVARNLLHHHTHLLQQQIALARNERFRNRIKAVRDLCLSASVLALFLLIGVTLWSARQASGLVIEPFNVPGETSIRGLDGAVLASHLLDRLQTMQLATDSSRASSSYSNNWSNSLSIDVPQTGLSVGEIWTLLRRLLGQETYLSGDMVQRDDTLILTARIDNQPSLSVSGPSNTLPALLDQMAAAIYRQAQPYRYSVWLSLQDEPGSKDILRELVSSNDKTEQLWGLVGQSVNALPTDPSLALALARDALTLDPSFQKARWNVVDALSRLGWSEAHLRESRLIQASLKTPDPRVTEASQGLVRLISQTDQAFFLKDYETVLATSAKASLLPDYSQNVLRARYEHALALIGLHAVPEARQYLARVERTFEDTVGASPPIHMYLYVESGHLDAVAERTFANLPDVAASLNLPASSMALIARAAILNGKPDIARQLLDGRDTACYDCILIRAKLAQTENKPNEAVTLLTRATQLGPSLPDAWLELGLVHLGQGRTDAAISAFDEANRRGPRWADPLKAWGDALVVSGKPRQALAKYHVASQRAPQWGGLYLAWAEALKANGRTAKAKQKYHEAARRFLTSTERARLPIPLRSQPSQ